MKKLLSTLLSLTLLLALSAPALADMGYVPTNADPEWVAWKDAWIEANPDAWAAFDPDLWFAQHYEYYDSEEEYMEIGGLTTREEFEANMADAWLSNLQLLWENYLPQAREYADDHPEEYVAFSAEDWVDASWYTTKEDFMTMWQVDEETFRLYMWAEYVSSLSYPLEPEAQEWIDAHPDETAAFFANIESYVAEEWSWYGSVAEMAENWGESEAYVRDVLLEEWALNQISLDEAKLELAQIKADLGGVPGQFGVMLNGEYITLPDAVPEAVNGRIMVPYRALMEALGGEVDYDETTQTVSCILDDTTLTLTLGENVLTIDANGEASTLEMDCAAYAKNNRTYVPVRFISQAFGYDVLWDQGFETAVVLDRQGAIEEIDGQFTILNRALSALTPDWSQSYQSKGSVTADLTLFDTINGNKTYRLTADASGVTKGLSSQGSMDMDLSSLGKIIDLDALLEEEFGWYSDEEIAQLRALFNSLGNLSFEYIVNAEDHVIYLRSPLLGILDEELADAWLAWYDAWEGDPSDFESLTIGSLFYEIEMANINTDYDPDWAYGYMYGSAPVYAWSSLTDSVEQLAAVLGDEHFTHTAKGDVLTLDAESLNLEDTYYYYNPLELTITVANNGAVTGSFDVGMGMEDLYGLISVIPGTAAVLSGEFSFSQGRSSLTADIHLKNTFRLELKCTGATVTTASEPLTAPPEGDRVIDAEEAL